MIYPQLPSNSGYLLREYSFLGLHVREDVNESPPPPPPGHVATLGQNESRIDSGNSTSSTS